jgi:hypothetical protein
LYSLLGSAPGARRAPLEGAAFVLAHATPDARILTGLKGPLKASVHDGAAAANALGFLNLQKCWSRVADWEKELRVLVEAGCAITPIHADQSLHS